ncbi:MAG TPA: FliH/SctL family protein [Anaeromyxobacteraceae bacterium]|jgi:flagellar assembly protein FliH
MAIDAPRRPRFLAAVPDALRPEAARFARTRPSPARTAAAPAAPAPGELQAGAGEEARREALSRVSQALETLRAQTSSLAEQARADALEIGFQVARKILESEVRTSPEPLFALVKSALRRAGDARRVVLRLAPDDAARVQTETGRASLDGVTAARVEVFPDPALQPGDCLVETDFGQIDGRLETRIAELRRAVRSAVEGAA